MFTGIVEAVGRVHGIKKNSGKGPAVLQIEAPGLSKRLKVGGSVAVNGACLTLVKKRRAGLFFELVRETEKRTNLGLLVAGGQVNLERPLKASARIEGHFVQGHVDGLGQILEIKKKGQEKSMRIGFPKALKPFIVEKGSVVVNGVSLTLGKVLENSFWIHCIPHTLKVTNFQDLTLKTKVNLEADLLMKLAVRELRKLTS